MTSRYHVLLLIALVLLGFFFMGWYSGRAERAAQQAFGEVSR